MIQIQGRSTEDPSLSWVPNEEVEPPLRPRVQAERDSHAEDNAIWWAHGESREPCIARLRSASGRRSWLNSQRCVEIWGTRCWRYWRWRWIRREDRWFKRQQWSSIFQRTRSRRFTCWRQCILESVLYRKNLEFQNIS